MQVQRQTQTETQAQPEHGARPHPQVEFGAVDCLLLDGCHAVEVYLDHPCDQHAEELVQVHACLLAAAADADDEACSDLLGVAAEVAALLAAAAEPVRTRGAA